jgi:hypothetical protein
LASIRQLTHESDVTAGRLPASGFLWTPVAREASVRSLEVREEGMTRGALLRFGIGAVFALAGSVVGLAPANVAQADAAGCVRIVGGVFDSPDNDNYMPYLNQEYVIIQNACSSSKLMTGWKVHDYNRIHVYRFPTGYRIGSGNSVKLRSGTGTNSSTNVYWKRTYGAVWNNDPPERAYLRKPDGSLANSWSSY